VESFLRPHMTPSPTDNFFKPLTESVGRRVNRTVLPGWGMDEDDTVHKPWETEYEKSWLVEKLIAELGAVSCCCDKS